MNNYSIFLSLSEDFIGNYLSNGKGLSLNTIKSYKYAFRLLIEFMYKQKGIDANKIQFSNLDYNTLLSFFDWIVSIRKCSTKTRNQRLAALMSFSEYAQNRNFDAASVFRNSIIKIPFKKTKSECRSWFDTDEIKIILNLPNEYTAIGLRDKVLLCIMYATGARAQEICDLTVSSIRFSNNNTTIDIQGKGNKYRRVKISEYASKILKNYITKLHIEHTPNKHIFSSQTHEKMSVSCIEEIVRKYIKKAKQQFPNKFLMKSYHPHSFRHTTATHMLEAGVPIMVIKNFLGHSSIQTTQVYAELTQNTVDKYVSEWNEKWFNDYPTLPEQNTSNNNIPSFLNI